jgi:hypothetical protein
MTNKKHLIFCSAAMTGAMSIALALLPTHAAAQMSGSERNNTQRFDPARNPRPDFPGPKENENDPGKSPKSDVILPKQGDSQPQN